MLAVSRIGEAGTNVSRIEFREVGQNFRFARSIGEQAKHIIHRYPETADCRLTATFARLDRDPVHLFRRHGLGGRGFFGFDLGSFGFDQFHQMLDDIVVFQAVGLVAV